MFEDDFLKDTLRDGTWKTHGRGSFSIKDGVLSVTDGWVSTGSSKWSNYSVEFRSRAPQGERQVQIWAGFRHYNRDYRYVVALRGGPNNQLYLARYSAEGQDKFLKEVPLDFTPATGVWYDLKVVVAGQMIAVYLNGESEPRILEKDEESPITSGGVSLGGSYLATEFDRVKVMPVDANVLDGVKTYQPTGHTAECRELQRKMQRSAYRPFHVPLLYNKRNEFPLNGDWLFVPDYEAKGDVFAEDFDDRHAHVMDVPDFWVPFAAWLEGIKMSGGHNRGQNDKVHRLDEKRCSAYTFDYQKTQSAWYRHYIDFPKDIASKEVVLDFPGIALISTIYFNGKKIQDHIGMFSPQKINVTDLVKAGRNVIAVQCRRKWEDDLSGSISTAVADHYTQAWEMLAESQKEKPKSLVNSKKAEKLTHEHIAHGFFENSPGGIWRNVRLLITEKVKVEDFYFKPSLDGADIDVTYANYGDQPQDVTLRYAIKHKVTGEPLCGDVIERKKLAADEKVTTSFRTPKVSPLLWAPGEPNLYNITFSLEINGALADELTQQVGFRTIEVKGQEFFLNGKPYWIRGANHSPSHVKPYDEALARKFMGLCLEYNVVATRTHCAPFSETWFDAADETGVMVSFEGPFPWLMMRDMPSDEAIDIWKREMMELVKANRNRPSIIIWTMNNEMNFYWAPGPDEIALEKATVLNDVMKMVRHLDPTRPLIVDSGYFRQNLIRSGRFARMVQKYGLDDGDIDDPHRYFGWYNSSFFHYMKGEFGDYFHTPGRALMGQEISTGYPRADDAMPTRSYLFEHQTPQTTVGKDAYEQSDPEIFITRQSMLTKELCEMFRRVEHERSIGLMLFAFHTWFYHNHDVNQISPMLTACRLKLAYEPILASAELWGRHFYAGDSIVSDITLINENKNCRTLNNPVILCQLASNGKVLASQEVQYPTLKYFKRAKKTLTLPIPETPGAERIDGQLVLRVMVDGAQVSRNEYDVTVATRAWGTSPGIKASGPYYTVEGDESARRLSKKYGLSPKRVALIGDLVGKKGTLIVTDADKVKDYLKITSFVKAGGNAILLNNHAAVVQLAPDIIKGYRSYRHEIVTMNCKESPVFDGLDPLDLSWFSDRRDVPFAANGRFSLDRCSAEVTALAETLEWHGYVNIRSDYSKFGGVPLFELRLGKGKLLVSEVRTDAIDHDPINARVIGTILKYGPRDSNDHIKR